MVGGRERGSWDYMQMNLTRARIRNISLAIAGALAFLAIAWFWYQRADPQGESGFYCDKLDFDPIANTSGWAVSGHFTICGGFGGSGAVYMYVHPIKESEGREYLAFRYSDNDGHWPPKVIWKNEHEVIIQVDHLSQVTKKLSSIGPIKITYQIAKQDFEMSGKSHPGSDQIPP